MRLTATALVLTGLVITGCSSSTSSGNDSGPTTTTCQSARDCATVDPTQCAAPKVCVCSSQATSDGGHVSTCVPVCQTNADCTGNQICVEGSCSNPGCGGNSDCTGGQVCIGGACESATGASQIHSCVVTPSSADVHQGNTVQLSAVAQDSSGNALPFTGVVWSVVSGPATINASTGLVTGGTTATSAAAAIKATVSSTVSCTATVNVYGTQVATTSLRVVVVDEDTKVPVSGALVVLDSDTAHPQTAGADGSVTFTLSGAAGAHNVHAFAANHDYASFIGVSGTDLLIPLRQFYPIAQRAEFDGTITTDDFAKLTETGQIAHVAFFGSSVSGSLLDFSLDNFIGKQRDVTVNIGGSQTLHGVPGGAIIGLGSDLYTTGSYSMFSDPGPHVLWGIGGNLDINSVLTIVSQVTAGGSSVNIGSLLPQVLPLLGNLEVGEVVGVTPGASGATPTPTNLSVTLDTPMRMNVAVKSPNLPQFNGTYVDGVIALTGASAFPLGFTPLGLTAGLAATDSNSVKTGAVLDPTCKVTATVTTCATNNLPLSMAARNHGLESYPFGIVLVALNFGALTSANGTIAVSGMLKTQDTIAFSGGTAAPTAVDMSAKPFMKLPGSANTVSYSRASRTVTITADADAATQIYKFTLQNANHQTWSVYLPPAGAAGGAGSTAVLIDPTTIAGATLLDVQSGGSATGWLSAIATTSSANTYASLTGFGNVTVDALGNNLSSFAVQTVALGP